MAAAILSEVEGFQQIRNSRAFTNHFRPHRRCCFMYGKKWLALLVGAFIIALTSSASRADDQGKVIPQDPLTDGKAATGGFTTGQPPPSAGKKPDGSGAPGSAEVERKLGEISERLDALTQKLKATEGKKLASTRRVRCAYETSSVKYREVQWQAMRRLRRGIEALQKALAELKETKVNIKVFGELQRKVAELDREIHRHEIELARYRWLYNLFKVDDQQAPLAVCVFVLFVAGIVFAARNFIR